MQGGLERSVLRFLAVAALIAAAAVGFYIVAISGVIGSGSGGEAARTTATTATTTTAAAPAEEPAAGETTATTGQNTYTIKPGDSFASIAAEHNTSIAKIIELNPNVNPQNLKPGTEIKVP